MIMDTGRWDILTAFAVLVKCLFLPGSHAAYCPQKSRPERRCGRNSGCCQQGKGEEAVEENVHIKIPERAEQIIDAIEGAGFEAYAVGGCVRDSILGREPQDWDITTSARPEQVKALFPRCIDTGIQHGTVTVMMGREGFEVTTYRVDGKYEDGRHPTEVQFTPSLEEDLKRRDFTINAMAYNHRQGLVDIFGGREDMDAGLLRCVGNPAARFSEDALRILRAVRFSAQLGYEIEEGTREGIRLLSENLRCISAERIQAELVKLVCSPHPDFLREAYALGVTRVFFPEFDRAMETEQEHPHHCFSVGEHILHSMKAVRADRILRLAMLFHDLGKPDTLERDHEGITHFHGHSVVSADLAKKILRHLKFDNDTCSLVQKLVLYHDYGNDQEPDMRKLRRAVNKIGTDAFPGLFEVKRADILAQSDYHRQEKLERLEHWQELYRRVMDERQCISLKQLAVSGRDLIADGMEPGKEVGRVLQQLLELVLEDPGYNTRERLLEEAKNILAG